MPGVPDKITGKTRWTCDVALPGTLHARMVRPVTLGSTLISVGALDKMQYPTAQVVTKGNLVAVLSPNEWEAIGAANSVAVTTKWTEWAGLPSSDNLTKAIRDYKWGAPSQSKGNPAEVNAALRGARKTISATYELPYVRQSNSTTWAGSMGVPSRIDPFHDPQCFVEIVFTSIPRTMDKR